MVAKLLVPFPQMIGLQRYAGERIINKERLRFFELMIVCVNRFFTQCFALPLMVGT